jgi:hypothetical protein
MLPLLPFEGRDIKNKTKQREVQDGRELPEYQLSSGIFQRLASGTLVSGGGLNNINIIRINQQNIYLLSPDSVSG